MQESKLRINLQQGLLEVEGSENLVKEIYLDFKELLKSKSSHLVSSTKLADSSPIENIQAPLENAKKSKIEKKVSSKKISNGIGTLVKDLNLKGGSSLIGLRDFHNQYEIKSNMERNVIFVYYLQYKMEVENININHVFTCYREASVKIPKSLKQSIVDTSGRKGWLETSDTSNIQVTVTGTNYIEHDLQKKMSNDN